MAESDPPQPPPSPSTAADAIADAHHGVAASAHHPRLQREDGTVLFGSQQPPSISTEDATPLPTQRKRRSSSTQSTASSKRTTASKQQPASAASSAARKTPSSAASAPSSTAATNRSSCLTNGFHKFSRDPLYALSQDIAADDTAFEKYETAFVNSINQKFKQEYKTKASFLNSLDSQPRTRSSAPESVVEVDVEAESLTTSDPRRLSRLHWEDALMLAEGQRLKMFVTKAAVLNEDGWWQDTFSSVLDALKLKTQQFNKSPMYCFDVKVCNAPLHNEIFKGDHSISQLETMFNRGDGFTITFEGTSTNLSISWQKMLHSSSSIMMFTSPLPRTRTYAELFYNAGTIQSVRRIFHCLSYETAGDYSASAALMIAYQKKERDVLKDMVKKAKQKTAEDLCSREEFIPVGGTSLVEDIDERCNQAFLNASSKWEDFQSPLLKDEDFESWIERAEVQFPLLWTNLCNVRNVNDRQSRHLVSGKKIQVLHQILSIFRQRDSSCLKWWALIEAMGLLAWGVGRTALDTLSYFGTHVSCPTRDRLLKEMFGEAHKQRLAETLSAEKFLIFIIDNFQKGQRFKNQRGGHSGNFMSGTNQIAEKPRVYDKPGYNELKPKRELKYNVGETVPSPDGMAPYEKHRNTPPSTFYLNHKSMESALAPDLTGARVEAYMDRFRVANQLRNIRHVFIEAKESTKFFPDNLDKLSIKEFRKLCSKHGLLFAAARDFQLRA